MIVDKVTGKASERLGAVGTARDVSAVGTAMTSQPAGARG